MIGVHYLGQSYLGQGFTLNTVTTTRTQTGVSRITATASRTQTGITRITATTTRNQLGLSRVTQTVQRTQTGTSRIEPVTSQPQTGISRIDNTGTAPQTGVARIGTTVNTDTYPGTALKFTGATGNYGSTTVNSPAATTDSISLAIMFKLDADGANTPTSHQLMSYRYWRLHVRNTTNSVQFRTDDTLSARVASSAGLGAGNRTWHMAVGVYTPTGGTNYNLKVYVDGVLSGSSDVASGTLPTTNYNATGMNITASNSMTGSVKRSAIFHRALTLQEISDWWTYNMRPSDVYFLHDLNEGSGTTLVEQSGNGHPNGTIIGTGHEWATGPTGAYRLYGRSRIANIVDRQQTGISRIAATIDKEQTGKAAIRQTTSADQTGVARISSASSKPQTGVARISATVPRTQTGRAAVRVSVSRTQTGLSRVTAVTQRNQNGVSKVSLISTRNTTGTSRIQLIVSRPQTGVSMIGGLVVRDISGKSRITASSAKVQYGKARLVKPISGVPASEIGSYIRRNLLDAALLEAIERERLAYIKRTLGDAGVFDEVVPGPTPSWPS